MLLGRYQCPVNFGLIRERKIHELCQDAAEQCASVCIPYSMARVLVGENVVVLFRRLGID